MVTANKASCNQPNVAQKNSFLCGLRSMVVKGDEVKNVFHHRDEEYSILSTI